MAVKAWRAPIGDNRRRRPARPALLAVRNSAIALAMSASLVTRSLAWLADALVDPRRRERTAAALLVGYAAIWTLYAVIAKGSQDIHFDMGEVVAWSRELALGTPKHPPLSAWLAGTWFTFFPLADWAFYLLAMAVATAGLWIAWCLSARWLDGEKRAAGLALLTLVPFFNFQALKFNANEVLIPLWAACTFAFLRSFETRRPAMAALAGLAAAAAMLGKYWSIVLLAGLAVAAVADPRRAAYFRSSAPWITVAVGALAIAPHVGWLIANAFSPFGYAMASHAAGTFAHTIVSAASFLAGSLGYMAVPALLVMIAARPSAAAVSDSLWPAAAERRIAVIAFAAPLLIATAAALLAGAEIVSLWSMPALSLLPVVLLSSPLVTIPRPALVRLLALALALPLVALALSPIIAMVIHRNGVPNHASQYRLVAAAIERAWRDTTDRPLRLVGSYTNLVNGVAFYLADRPSTYDVVGPYQTPWTDDARIAREGIALVCPLDEAECIGGVDALAARHRPGRRTEVEITRRFLGMPDAATRYRIITVPSGG
jgi:hypothetical protein